MLTNKILIIEDDEMLSEALKTSLTRIGLECDVASKPADALEFVKNQSYSLIVSDCFLPQMPGVDLIVDIKKNNPTFSSHVILMSGIYTDKQFIKESILKTQAVCFLKKPFELAEFIQEVKKHISIEQDFDETNLISIFSSVKLTNREKRKAIENINELHGFYLPLIYSSLVESRSSGFLNIIHENGQVSGVSFSNGSIVSVDIADKETYLGKLLIDKGYILSEDLEVGLKIEGKGRLGQKLINNNLVSPHALTMAVESQMNIRLSKTVMDENVKINFSPSDVEGGAAEINSDNLAEFLQEWVASKISLDWLKSQLMKFENFQIQLTPAFAENESVIQTQLVANCEGLLEDVSSGASLSQMLNSGKYSDELLHQAIYFMFCKGSVVFSVHRKIESNEERVKNLVKLHNKLKDKNKLEIYELMGGNRKKDISTQEIKKVYQDFLAYLGLEPSDQSESALIQVYKELFNLTSDVYNLMSNPAEREAYENEISKAELDKKLKSQNMFEESKQLINKGQPQKALELLNTMQTIDSNFPLFKIYLAYAKVRCLDFVNDKNKLLKEIEQDLLHVPAEEKYNALYYYVNGLSCKAKGKTSEAKKFFEKCIAVDATMVSAKREISLLREANKNASMDLFNSDLKGIVSGMFKRK